MMAATAISNSMDKRQLEQREKAYLDAVKKYDEEELGLFPPMYAQLVLILQKYAEERCPRDVLGEIFHELNLQSEWHGQFFSPQHICDMIGEISIGEQDLIVEKYKF